MKVLFLASYFPHPGNPQMGSWALQQAHAFRRQGMDVRVVAMTAWVPKALSRACGGRAAHWASCPPEFSWDGLRAEYPRWLLYQVGWLKRRAFRAPAFQHGLAWLTARRGLRRLMREWKPDVVYAHNTITNGSLARRLKAEFGTPYVITDHGFDEVIGCEQHPRRRRVFGGIARHAFRMIAIASSMAEVLRRVEPAARIEVVPNGVDPVPEPMWSAPRPAETAGKAVIFSAGVFYELKGFPYLVQAFARVAGKHPDAILRIAGDGVQRGEIERAIGEANLQGRVQLIGMKRTAEVRQEMVWADVFALLSWNDLFPTVILEAMSAACAIVCTSASGIVDVVKDGVHGFVVPPRDVDAAAAALDRLLSNPADRSRMAAAGRTLVEQQLSWDAHAVNMGHIFEEAIAASTTSPGDKRLEHAS